MAQNTLTRYSVSSLIKNGGLVTSILACELGASKPIYMQYTWYTHPRVQEYFSILTEDVSAHVKPHLATNLRASGGKVFCKEKGVTGRETDSFGIPGADEQGLTAAARGTGALVVWLVWSHEMTRRHELVEAMQRATAISEFEIQVVCVNKHHGDHTADVLDTPEQVAATVCQMRSQDDARAPHVTLVCNYLTNGGETDRANLILKAVAAEAKRRGAAFAHPGKTALSLEVSKSALQPFLRKHGLAELSLAEYDANNPPTRFPVFVKPFKGGGSNGVSIVKNEAEFQSAIGKGGGWDKMLAQEALEGQDVWTVYITAWKGELVRRSCRLYRFDPTSGNMPLTHGGDTAVEGLQTSWVPCASAPLSLEQTKRLAQESDCHGFCCVNMKERPGASPGIFDFNARIGGGLFRSTHTPSVSGWPDYFPAVASKNGTGTAVPVADNRSTRCLSENVLDGGTASKLCVPPPLIMHLRAFIARAALA